MVVFERRNNGGDQQIIPRWRSETSLHIEEKLIGEK